MSVLFRFKTSEMIVHRTKYDPPSPVSSVHNLHELYVFLGGSGSFFIEGRPYALSPGSILLMRAGETHYPQIDKTCVYDRMALHFSPSLLKAIDPDDLLSEPLNNRPLGQMNLYNRRDLSPVAESCLSVLERATGTGETDAEIKLFILSSLTQLLFELRRLFLRGAVSSSENEIDLAGSISAFINEHLTEDFSLDTLAERFFLSKAYINRIFRRSSGTTVWRHVLTKRLFLARSRILSGTPPAKAAEESGWNEYSAFYRSYKAAFGESPGTTFGGG